MNAKKIDQSASSKTASSKAAAQVGKKAEELHGSRLLSDIEAFKAGCIASDGKSNAPVRSARASLLDAIAAYRAGRAAFEKIKEADWPALGGEEAVIEKTYGPALAAMMNWDRPASNEEEAVAALHAAQGEEDEFRGSDITSAMLRAALAYFDGRKNVRDNGYPSLKDISMIYDAVRDADAALGISIFALGSTSDSLVGTELTNSSTGTRLIDDVANLETVVRMIRNQLDTALARLSDIEFKWRLQSFETADR